MNKWIKRLLLVLQLGGGFFGAMVAISAFTQPGATTSARCIYGIFCSLYVFGIVAGLLLAENLRKRSFFISSLPRDANPTLFLIHSQLPVQFGFGSWPNYWSKWPRSSLQAG